MDIKLKNKRKKGLLLFLLFAGAILVCFGLFFFFDHTLNGTIVDWLDKNFMLTFQEYIPEVGADGFIHRPDWIKVKELGLILLLSNVIVWLLVVLLASHFYARRKTRKTINAMSQMLREYMFSAKEASEIFPDGYGEISAQVSEIKANIQRQEQILKDGAAQKNDSITYLAHDLKTPLTSVIGYLNLLDEAPDMPQQQKAKYVHIALDKAYRLEKLVNEFFEITRYNLQQVKLDKSIIDLYYMLVQMMDEFYPILSANGNTATLHADENLTVYGDPVKLARVFNNILKNAAAYSKPGSEILITAGVQNGNVVIAFQNQGQTIPAEKLSIIFEKFYRLDEARTSNTGGAGLGLAIAKEIITLHGGTITAESENDMTTFTVSLPVQS